MKLMCAHCLKRLSLALSLFVGLSAVCSALAALPEVVEVSSTKIWDKAPHNAFTDMIRWHDRFYCTFREGERHVHGADGTVRLITSVDGKKWNSIGLIVEKGVDLRDPKLSITPDDRLMVVMGGSTYKNRNLKSRLARVAFLEHGQTELTESVPVVIDLRIATNNDWLWRVTWHNGVGYGGVYQAFYKPGTKKGTLTSETRPWAIHLVKTTDGVNYDLVSSFEHEGTPGESTVLIQDDGTMMFIIRNKMVTNLGTSKAPYTNWEWKNFELALGGPDLIRLPNNKIILGTREINGTDKTNHRMVLGTLTADGTFTKRVQLVSGGDTSYPGMLVHEGKLWVCYYSSHEGNTSIYLAKVPLDSF